MHCGGAADGCFSKSELHSAHVVRETVASQLDERLRKLLSYRLSTRDVIKHSRSHKAYCCFWASAQEPLPCAHERSRAETASHLLQAPILLKCVQRRSLTGAR